jgi:hypothetical protein
VRDGVTAVGFRALYKMEGGARFVEYYAILLHHRIERNEADSAKRIIPPKEVYQETTLTSLVDGLNQAR